MMAAPKLSLPNRVLTVEGLFNQCFKEHWSRNRYQVSGWAKEVSGLYTRHIAKTFGSSFVTEIRASQIRTWYQTMEDTPTTANLSIRVLSKLFNFAQEKEWIQQGHNPCSLVKRFKERKRRRYATSDEIRKIGELLKKEAQIDPRGAAFLYILIFTGARPRSIERATRAMLTHLIIEGKLHGILTFQGKTTAQTGEDETLILPPEAMAILEKLPKDLKTLTGTKMPRDLWNRIRKEAGCEDLWARDWRRTFATIGLSNGSSQGVIGELLNHKSTQTTAIYAKLTQDKKLSTAKDISERLSDMLKGKK